MKRHSLVLGSGMSLGKNSLVMVLNAEDPPGVSGGFCPDIDVCDGVEGSLGDRG